VHRYRFYAGDDNGNDTDTLAMIYLSFRTVENDARHDWREFQRIKNELAGPDWWAVEIYPAETDLHDSANQWHLWCWPERPQVYLPTLNVRGDFGMAGRLVMSPEELAEDPDPRIGPCARQRPFTDIKWPYDGPNTVTDDVLIEPST